MVIGRLGNRVGDDVGCLEDKVLSKFLDEDGKVIIVENLDKILG